MSCAEPKEKRLDMKNREEATMATGKTCRAMKQNKLPGASSKHFIFLNSLFSRTLLCQYKYSVKHVYINNTNTMHEDILYNCWGIYQRKKRPGWMRWKYWSLRKNEESKLKVVIVFKSWIFRILVKYWIPNTHGL